MSKSKRIAGPFTSEYGTFNPGDKCIVVTVCTGRVNVARAEYVGYIERPHYNWQTKETGLAKYAQVRRPTSRWGAYVKGTDIPAKWPYSTEQVDYKSVEGTIVSTLQYNRLMPATASTDDLIKVI